MDNRSGDAQAQRKLCKSGCGFYGSEATQGYCSACARAMTRTPAVAPAPSAAVAAGIPALDGGAMGGSAAMPAAVSLGAAAGASVGSPAKSLVPASPAAVRAPPVAHGTSPAASAATSSAVAPPLPGTPLAAAPAVPAASPPPEAAAAEAVAAPAAAAAPRSPKELQTKRDRCWTCKKKTGLTGFECRCGFVFCGTHRYADEHACTFDYVAHDRGVLDKRNPKVVGDKLGEKV